MDAEQVVELARVRERIAASVLAFCRAQLADGCNGVFHMVDLSAAVSAELQSAPDSPGRILRDLRQKGLLNYRVLCRRESRYQVLWVEGPMKQGELF